MTYLLANKPSLPLMTYLFANIPSLPVKFVKCTKTWERVNPSKSLQQSGTLGHLAILSSSICDIPSNISDTPTNILSIFTAFDVTSNTSPSIPSNTYHPSFSHLSLTPPLSYSHILIHNTPLSHTIFHLHTYLSSRMCGQCGLTLPLTYSYTPPLTFTLIPNTPLTHLLPLITLTYPPHLHTYLSSRMCGQCGLTLPLTYFHMPSFTCVIIPDTPLTYLLPFITLTYPPPSLHTCLSSRMCGQCGQFEDTVKFKACSRCHCEFYCSVDCQKKGWKVRSR